MVAAANPRSLRIHLLRAKGETRGGDKCRRTNITKRGARELNLEVALEDAHERWDVVKFQGVELGNLSSGDDSTS